MQFSITFRHMEASDHLKDYAREKLSKLQKYFDSVLVAEVTLTVEKFRHKAEAVIKGDGLLIKAEEETDDMYSALDILSDKVERQAKRRREKVKDRKAAQNRRQAGRSSQSKAQDDDLDDYDLDFWEEGHSIKISRTRRVSLLSLTPEEAAERMVKGADEIMLFVDLEDGAISLLYQRPDGKLDLIKPNV